MRGFSRAATPVKLVLREEGTYDNTATSPEETSYALVPSRSRP